MSMITDLLRSLGVNSTAGIQFIVFIVAFLVMYFVLFRPYFFAYTERVSRTMGHAEIAERFVAESQTLQMEYETKARELNAQFKSIFDSSRSEALREYDRVVADARQSAKTQLETAKTKINSELETARRNLQSEVPGVAEVITMRLIGKDSLQ